MLYLEMEAFRRAQYTILENGRELEKRLFAYYFMDGPANNVVEEIAGYQNVDGGFGNAIEPDFRLPASSPVATTVALQHLIHFDDLPLAKGVISKAIAYLDSTYISEREGWFAVPKTVNDYPHAPWWEFDEEKGMCAIDANWGNPTAEIIGYLQRYREFTSLDVDRLIGKAIEYLESKSEFSSFHEIFCFMRLYNLLDKKMATRLRPKLSEAVCSLISKDQEEWRTEYVARPLDFVSSPDEFYCIDRELIEDNIEYYIKELQTYGKIKPTWSKSFYDGEMSTAWDEWVAIITLRVLLILKSFGRIIL
ncbi:MAG: Uncharacterized protein XE02_0545 [Mesotoga infera]|jgi:hypothetical protein|uniref:Uncharacterized protein n=1 Tax=Mesotoga infera TaxID=1236046 RepID=A0A117LTS2_9BACT|nr:MAG: Uncharacterized protein XD86_0887 [Mesotoga infera]KUK90442.1 MAG: Uncharacterized protein XE02_0545 [Mesotoga infera]